MLTNLCLLVHFASTWAMVGLIWIVQLVHYPMFASLDSEQFSRYMEYHQRQISWIVLPLMMSELLTGLALWRYRPPEISYVSVLVGTVLLAVTWGATFSIQVPQHTRLLDGLDADVCRQLVSWNWIRTVAWTARGALVAWMTWQLLRI